MEDKFHRRVNETVRIATELYNKSLISESDWRMVLEQAAITLQTMEDKSRFDFLGELKKL